MVSISVDQAAKTATVTIEFEVLVAQDRNEDLGLAGEIEVLREEVEAEKEETKQPLKRSEG